MFKVLSGYSIMFAIAATPLSAQQDLAALARRVDSSRQVAIARQQTLVTYRTLHPPHFAYDDSVVIASGKVKVFFDPISATLAKAAAAEADKHLQELGSALDQLPTFLIAVVPDSSRLAAQLGNIGAVNVQYYASVTQRTPVRTSTEPDAKAIAYVILSTVGNFASLRLAPRVDHWLSGRIPLAPTLAAKPDWGELRLSMVSSPSRVGRSCFVGDVHACLLYLGLDSVSDPAHTLFDSTGRRLVVEYDAGRLRYASRDSYTRCVNGNDDACLAVLDLAGVGPLSSPYVRNSLLVEALSRGGSHSLERLMASSGSPGNAIAAAANEPLDSLVAGWQRRINAGFGTSANVPLSIVLSSLVCIGICAFLSLRSSRWR
jgi:hypothetical protein